MTQQNHNHMHIPRTDPCQPLAKTAQEREQAEEGWGGAEKMARQITPTTVATTAKRSVKSHLGKMTHAGETKLHNAKEQGLLGRIGKKCPYNFTNRGDGKGQQRDKNSAEDQTNAKLNRKIQERSETIKIHTHTHTQRHRRQPGRRLEQENVATRERL